MGNNDPILAQITTINPYFRAATLILERVKWDLNPQSWIARKRMRILKDRYSGQKAVILCNGPSLIKSDLSLLNNTFTFGLNKINLLFNDMSFRPSCIVAANRFVLNQNREFYNTTEIPLFLDSSALNYGIKQRKNIIYFHSTRINRFARDCSFSIYQGYTVTYIALQLAFHLGFREVALIGCDHDFTANGPPGMVVESENLDVDHFNEKYFTSGQKWQLPDLPGSEYAYHLAGRIYESSGRQIVNCTEGGLLDIFEKKSLVEFLHNN